MDFVYELGRKILANCGSPSTESNILPLGSLAGKLQRRVNAIGHEIESCATVHSNWLPGVIG